MTTNKNISKQKAFLWHLGFSLILLSSILCIVYFYWFPGFYLETDGGSHAMKILTAVDLILGPLLTLIIYKPEKSKLALRLDLSIIFLIQIASLSGGTWVAWANHPVATIYYEGSFNTLPRSAFFDNNEALSTLENIPGSFPKVLVIEETEDPELFSSLFQERVKAGRSILLEFTLYKPLNDNTINQIESRKLNHGSQITISQSFLKQCVLRASNSAYFVGIDANLQLHLISPLAAE